ncbi:hypothetical protein L0337_28320 [candidate division KSB1 bacterium]|nr:hypothetical protein [candidate division KSB1 bacterium]
MSQSAVNIVYPIDGGTYPITDPACGVRSAYFTASFSTTCAGGPHTVKWGFDGRTLGKASFYDQFSAQFTWKLPAGAHRFWVESDCGKGAVKFKIA